MLNMHVPSGPTGCPCLRLMFLRDDIVCKAGIPVLARRRRLGKGDLLSPGLPAGAGRAAIYPGGPDRVNEPAVALPVSFQDRLPASLINQYLRRFYACHGFRISLEIQPVYPEMTFKVPKVHGFQPAPE